jgi:hypothetical protein
VRRLVGSEMCIRDSYKEGTIKQLELDQIQNLLEEAQLQEENFKFQFNLQQLDLLKTQGIKFWEL